MTIPIQKLGWVAGVLDLKGKIVTKKNRSRATPQFVLMVESKDVAVVRELCSLTGTHVEIKPERKLPEWMRRPCAEHCPDKHEHVHAERPYDWRMPGMARWTATGVTAAIILHNVLPYSLANLGLEVALHSLLDQAVLVGQGSGASMKAIRRMHELGWELPEKFEEALSVRSALEKLDGTDDSAVALLAGMAPKEITQYGGMP